MRRGISTDEARQLALSLDRIEADLVGLQHRVYSVRKRLEEVVGEPVGYQYDQPDQPLRPKPATPNGP